MPDYERALEIREQHTSLKDFLAALVQAGIGYETKVERTVIRTFSGKERRRQAYVMVESGNGWRSVGDPFKMH